MHTNWCVLIEKSMEIGMLNFWLGLLVTALMEENYFTTQYWFLHSPRWDFLTTLLLQLSLCIRFLKFWLFFMIFGWLNWWKRHSPSIINRLRRIPDINKNNNREIALKWVPSGRLLSHSNSLFFLIHFLDSPLIIPSS